MSQRNIPESSILEQNDESDDKSEENWVIRQNTVTHHGKNSIYISLSDKQDMSWLSSKPAA